LPEISVVLPVYNGAEFLEAALASILEQKERDWELIAVDDGSTDGSAAILSRLARADRRIRVLKREHRGIVAALNEGLAAARGEFIARMDADDISSPDRLALQRQFLHDHPGIGLVATRVAYGGDAAVNRGFAHYVDWTNGLLEAEAIFNQRFVESPLIHPSVMFRRALVTRFGAYREGDFPEDYELWLRWLQQGVHMARLETVGLWWRERETRLSRVHARYREEAFYRCKQTFLAEWLKSLGITRVVVWGAGRRTRSRAEMLVRLGIDIHAYVDIDPRKIGNRIGDRPVWSKEELPPAGSCFLLSYVGNRGAREEISAYLTDRGYRIGDHYLPVA